MHSQVKCVDEMKLYSEDQMKAVREKFETEILQHPDVATKKMFGCPSYTAKGTLFAFLVTNGIVLTKLSEDERTEALSIPGGMLFEHNERVMKKWVRVPITDQSNMEEVMGLAIRSYEKALSE